MVTTVSPRAMRPVQRARLWAITQTASQAPFGKLRIGGEAARGQMVEAHAVLQVPDGVLDLGVAAAASPPRLTEDQFPLSPKSPLPEGEG